MPLCRLIQLATVFSLCASMAACKSDSASLEELAPEDDSPIFSSSVFGVPASPRVSRLKNVRKGGGRAQVGKPYQVRGKWYYPKEEPGYSKSGKASWYGANFHGRLTANGEVYDMFGLSGAHPTFPLPSYARVTNRKNGRSVVVRVNDRGPYWSGRVMDVSSKAAEMLGFKHDGIGEIRVDYIGRAPLEGDDTKALVASYRAGSGRPVDDGLPTGVMIADSQQPRKEVRLAAAESRRPKSMRKPSDRFAMPNSAGSIDDLIGAYDLPPAPVPTTRSLALSYATAHQSRGAALALDALSNRSGRTEVIEIGTVEDLDLLTRVAELTRGRGKLGEELAPGPQRGVSLTLVPTASENADILLRQLWNAGASDAFVLRD